MLRLLLQETYELLDLLFYSSDGTGMSGTYSTASDSSYSYITDCQSDVTIPNSVILPSTFEFSYKYRCSPSAPWSAHNSLWLLGNDANNGVLIGCEAEDHRIRIYNRSGGSNSVQQTQTNSFNYDEWVDVKIKYENGVSTITVGSNSISYSKTFNPSLLKLYSTYRNTKITDFKLKAL